MKTLITITLLSLSTASFAGSVGESSTECLKNRSTQSRDVKKVLEENSKANSSKETIQQIDQ
jgi:hypothetical protein